MRAKGTLAYTILQGKVEGERSRGNQQLVRRCKELNRAELWREPEDRLAWRKRVSRVAPTD